MASHRFVFASIAELRAQGCYFLDTEIPVNWNSCRPLRTPVRVHSLPARIGKFNFIQCPATHLVLLRVTHLAFHSGCGFPNQLTFNAIQLIFKRLIFNAHFAIVSVGVRVNLLGFCHRLEASSGIYRIYLSLLSSIVHLLLSLDSSSTLCSLDRSALYPSQEHLETLHYHIASPALLLSFPSLFLYNNTIQRKT